MLLSSGFQKLATHIRSLSIPTRACLSGSDKSAFVYGIRKLVNLEELYISHAMTDRSLDAYIEPRMLECVTSNLKIFLNDLEEYPLRSKGYLLFFKEHFNLTKIYWASGESGSPLPGDILPNLTIVHLKRWDTLSAFTGRKITRVRLGPVPMNLQLISAFLYCLSHFANSLTHLSVNIHEAGDIRADDASLTMVHVFRMLGDSVPALKFLDIHGDVFLVR